MNKSLCENFGICASCVLAENEKNYKLKRTKEILGAFYNEKIEFFDSAVSGFRSRAELRLWHDENGVHYAMNKIDKKPVIVQNCAIVDEKIARIMPKLLAKLNENFKLKERIFGVEFVTSKDEICVVLLYHKDILSIQNELSELFRELKVSIIARSRGKKLVFGDEILNEKLKINSEIFKYKISFDGFIQPNRAVNEKMIEYVYNLLKNKQNGDFLELYCGHGNFTLALARCFNKVLATEINKTSIALARQNAKLNNIENVKFLRLSAEELSDAFKGVREYNRLKDIKLSDYKFSHILVDPPRAGCAKSVIEIIKNYENIIYVSCAQDSLARDLELLKPTHIVEKMALFNQFAHTRHIETIAVLKRLKF